MKFFSDPNNLLLIAVAFVSGSLLVWPLVRRGAGGAAVDTLGATRLMNQKNALVLDIREADAFAKAHLIQSKHIPLEQLAERAKELNAHKAKPVVVVCQTGKRAGKAAGLLRAAGFSEVFVLDGGLLAWQQAGLPIAKG